MTITQKFLIGIIMMGFVAICITTPILLKLDSIDKKLKTISCSAINITQSQIISCIQDND